MTKQSIKEFFKPTKGKIITFAIFTATAFLVWFLAASECRPLDSLPLLLIFVQFLAQWLFLLFLISGWPLIILITFISPEMLKYEPSLIKMIILILYYYLLWCLFGQMKTISRWAISRKRKLLLIFLALLFLVGAAFVIIFSLFSCCAHPKDAGIKSAISQSRIIMISIGADHDNYDYFSCGQNDMKKLCKKIEKLEGQVFITHDKVLNSQAACVYSPFSRMKLTGIKACIEKFKTGQQPFTTPFVWYCADSTGVVGTTNINPASSGYCVDGVSAVCPPIIGD